ncbi:MAG: ABC transporter permease [Acidobacteriota bacterium]
MKTLRTVLRYRGLLVALTGRELKARYRGSALGFLWSLANPLLLLAVFAAVFGLFLGPRAGDASAPHPFVLFLVCGLFPWIWTNNTLLEGTQSLSSNAGLIRRASFPLEILPAVTVSAQLVHFLLALPILVLALVLGRLLGYSVLGLPSLLVPVAIALHLLMLSGMVLGLSSLSVHFKDVRDLLANVLQLLFFLAPIIYSIEFAGRYGRWLHLNPFTPFTLAYQSLLYGGTLPPATIWLEMAGWSVLSWLLGSWIFTRLRETVAEAV